MVLVEESDLSQDEWDNASVSDENEVDENTTPRQRRGDSVLEGGRSVLDSAARRGKSVGKILHGDEGNKNFKVVLRVRPALPRELNGEKRFQNIVKIEGNRSITVSENLTALEDMQSEETTAANFATYLFTFDHVYGENSDQLEVYNNTAREAVESTLQGYNATIIAYGQTGTGKTYTMEGEAVHNVRGIIPRATEDIFKHIECTASERKKFLVRASYLQIYNEVISDLLKPERTNLHIREDKRKGVFVEGLSEWVVRTPKEVYGLMQRGALTRATASTKMNEISSRSHAVFIIILEQLEYREEEEEEETPPPDQQSQVFKVGKLNLVDLAGSERVRLTGATGRRLEECKKINQSLSTLGNVIAALTTQGRSHIPYRDSKLTRILEDSLGGNCKTTMMAMISPALEAFVESLSTLKFANRAKNIKNEARVNEDLDQKALLRKYEREIKKLRQELDLKQRTIVDKRRVLQLEERSRQAEADKLAAIQALEERSREFMTEKQEKKRLEQRLTLVQSAMLTGGQKVEDTPAFRTALQKEHNRIHQEYEERLADLERERMAIEEDKAQVDRYKQLLLKQRDIMIALTARLNERDDTITRLQEELDAYDQHQRMMEDVLDQKTAALIHLQRVTMEQANSSPEKNAQIMQALGPWGREGLQTPITPLSDENIMLSANGRTYSSSNDGVVFRTGDGDSARNISAEEKIAELTQLLEDAHSDQARAQQQLDDVQAEKSSLEFILREKLEKMVQAEIEDRIAEFRRENGRPGSQRNSNGSPGSPSSNSTASTAAAHDEIRRMEREMKDLQKQLRDRDDQTVSARREAAEAKSLLNNFQKELNGKISPTEVQRLLERVKRSEDENNRLKEALALAKKINNGLGVAKGVSVEGEGEGEGGETGMSGDDKEKIHLLEGRVESLRHQHQQFRQEVTGRFEQKNKLIKELEEENGRLHSADGNAATAGIIEKLRRENERLREEMARTQANGTSPIANGGTSAERDEQARKIAVLKQFCTMNVKERTALKTILEVKVKGLVDSVARNIGDLGSEHRVSREVQALQKLINASVNAMKSDEHPPLDDMLRETEVRAS